MLPLTWGAAAASCVALGGAFEIQRADTVERTIQFVAGSASSAKVVDLTEDGGGSL